MSAPAVVIRLELEGPVIVYADAVTEGEQIRLEDWVRSNAARLELVQLALHVERKAA